MAKLRSRKHDVKIGDRIPYIITITADKELYKRAEDPKYAL